jgi:hypothetical protein
MTANGTTAPAPTSYLTREVCAKVTATMAPVVHRKIAKAYVAALNAGHELLAADMTSPAGEHVMAFFEAEITRLGWSAEVRRAMRLNIRVIGMNLIREAADLTR